MRRLRARLIGAGVLSAGALAASIAQAACVFEVGSYNDPQRTAQGDLAARVVLSDVPTSALAIGYGAAAFRRDEITIADGALYLVRPDGAGGVSLRRHADPGEGALMLQTVPVEAWSVARSLESMDGLDDLSRVLDEAVAAAGCADGARLAFRLEGRLLDAEYSLDTAPERADRTVRNRAAIIVGLYASTPDAARYALPAGRRFHPHVVLPASGEAGHLRSVRLAPGGKLQLQTR
ncbi:hypothetical protein P7B02_15535 [Caulobacter segnis]|uniref:hypothetical protein n=1 Tax=Caulobacter segnis TaxID=88688 RepID=UPI002410AA6C|nr:hypothetical protein [Caulobacter segnis]MDG2522947.1 hypothetical protein [Caulobacter segnis]